MDNNNLRQSVNHPTGKLVTSAPRAYPQPVGIVVVHFEVLINSLSRVPPKIIFPAFQLFELKVIFSLPLETPHYDEGESSSSESTTPEEV